MADTQKVRLFVAIFPSGEVVQKLTSAVADLRHKLSPRAVRWTLPEQMHLTMAFIGSVEQERVTDFELALASVAQKSAGSFLECSGVGCFPDARRPRVLWAGLTGELSPLLDLQKNLEQSLKNLGYVPEDRPFHPHLTFGRVNPLHSRESQILSDFLTSFQKAQFGQWQADRIDLMRSDLSPHGSKYTVLKSYPLKK